MTSVLLTLSEYSNSNRRLVFVTSKEIQIQKSNEFEMQHRVLVDEIPT